MAERCDLCGARVRPEDDVCRECGTPLRSGDAESQPPAQLPSGETSAPLSFEDIATPDQTTEAPSPSGSSVAAASLSTAAAVASASVAAPVLHEPTPVPVTPPPTGEEVTPPPVVVPAERSPTAPELQFGQPEPSVSFDKVPKSRAGLWVVLVLLLLGGGGAGVWLMQDTDSGPEDETTSDPVDPKVVAGTDGPEETPPPSTEGCEDLQLLAGKWSFTTRTTGSASITKLDLRGYFDLEVTVEGCEARAVMGRTGFTGSKFAKRYIQEDDAILARPDGALSFSYGGLFALRDSRNKGVDQEFFFTTMGDKLVGVWRKRGTQWAKAGLYGILLGEREAESESIQPTVAAMSCEARCAVSCDLMPIETPPASEAFDSCVASCDPASQEIPACGNRGAANAELSLGVAGPSPKVRKTLCKKLVDCELDPKFGKRGAARIEDPVGPWQEAHLVHSRGKGEGKKGSLRLSVRTEAGWFLTDGLVKLPKKDGLREVGVTRLATVDFGMGPDASILLGVAEVRSTQVVFGCRMQGEAPACFAVRGLTSSRDVAVLPGGTIALRSGDQPALQAW